MPQNLMMEQEMDDDVHFLEMVNYRRVQSGEIAVQAMPRCGFVNHA